MRFHLLLALCVLSFTPMSAHAGKAKRLYKLMDESEYRGALRKGLAYLETDKVRTDEKEVRLIMERAAYFIATENNEVRGYRTYLRNFPRSAYVSRVKEQLAQLEYEALLEDGEQIVHNQLLDMVLDAVE
jgi:hypothetical protein